jgi:dTDP-4-dehydrorhamnose reductase
MRLLVTGASGLLGLNLSLVASAKGHQVTGLIHSRSLHGVPFDLCRVNLLDTEPALHTIAKAQPEAIIHCAALADLNVAEKEPELARQLNRDVPGDLAKAASRWGIPFVHISTDAVFDGLRGVYREVDPVNPLSVYAQTKLEGEQVVQEAYPEAVIARVVFFGWSLSGNRSLSEFFFNNLRDGQPIKGFTDALFSPLYVEDLAEVLLEILLRNLSGLFHVVSPEHLSKYAFGVRIAKRFGFDPHLVEPVRMEGLRRDAQRALNLVLSPDKVQSALGHPLPSVQAGIDRFYQRWLEHYPQQLKHYAALTNE